MRLFLDANVLFTAAHNPDGKAALVLTLGYEGLWQLVTGAYAVEEASRNLGRKYPDRMETLEAWLPRIRIATDPRSVPCPTGLSEKDWPIYRAAIGCRADILLTGDIKDFGFLMNDPTKTNGLLIQTVSDFLSGLGSNQHK